MKIVWMIFFFREQEISEHKTHCADIAHYFHSLEAWDDEEYETEEKAIDALTETQLGKYDRAIIQKVFVKA